MDFPLIDLLDDHACYAALLSWLHPDGLAGPRCRRTDALRVHRRTRDPVLDYRCTACGRVFNAFTATALHGTHRRPAQVVAILRGVAQGTPTARLARELGCSRPHLLALRHKMPAHALAAADRAPPRPDGVVEADEVFPNAGEKRPAAPRPGRPAAAPRQPGAGARHLGQRPAAAAGGRGPRVGAAAPAAGAPDVGVGPGRVRRGADAGRGAGDDRRVDRVPGPRGGGSPA